MNNGGRCIVEGTRKEKNRVNTWNKKDRKEEKGRGEKKQENRQDI